MNKTILILSILALVASGCKGNKTKQTANNEIAQEQREMIETMAETAVVEAENEDAEMIDFEKLVLKGDVYYLNNVPFTGKAGYQKEMHESWEVKDGKFHGEYAYYLDGCETIGNYKNGKKHGKWVGSCDGEESMREIWENGVLISE